MSRLLQAAQRAYDRTTLYRLLYRDAPETEASIPFVSHTNYHRARGVVDCMTGEAEIVGAVPAYHRNVRRIPVNVVESEEEWILRQRRLVRALADLGIAVDGPRYSFLLIADDASGPFACELSKGLSWERHQASITYLAGSRRLLAADLAAYRPDIVVIVTPELSAARLPDCDARVVTVTHVERSLEPGLEGDEFVVCDELHVLGARPANDGTLYFDAAQLHLEVDPVSGLAAATTLDFDCFPLVRYSLGCALKVAPRPEDGSGGAQGGQTAHG